MGIKEDILWLKCLLDAGFTLAKENKVMTSDGYCWTSTLVKEKSSLVTVSNGGYGGPDELHFNNSNEEAKKALDLFYQICA